MATSASSSSSGAGHPPALAPAAAPAAAVPAAAPVDPTARALRFAETESELYHTHRADDDTATVEGCFPPEDSLPRARVIELLNTLVDLKQELSSLPTVDPYRVFRIKDTPLFTTLKDFDGERLEELKMITGYLLLPKELMVAVEQQIAIPHLKAAYLAALEAHNPKTAVEMKPRLRDFLLPNTATRPVVEVAMELFKYGKGNILTNVLCDNFYYVDEYEADFDNCLAFPSAACQRGFLDGLWGEPLSEFGYTPGAKRVCAYTAASVLMGRPIPYDSLPSDMHEVVDDEKSNCTPVRMAAALGKMELLKELKSRGHDFTADEFALAECAAARGQLEVLTLAFECKPEVFRSRTDESPLACGDLILLKAMEGGQMDVVRWLLIDAGLSAEILESEFGGRFSIAASDKCKPRLGVFKLLYAAAGPDFISPYAVAKAAEAGELETVKWAKGVGSSWDVDTMAKVLRSGNLALYDYCRQNGCGFYPPDHIEPGPFNYEPDPADLSAACEGFKGDIQMIEKVIADGAAVNRFSLTYLAKKAAELGYKHVITWMKEKGYLDVHEDVRQKCLMALSFGKLTVDACAIANVLLEGVDAISLPIYLCLRSAALKEGNADLLTLLARYPHKEEEIAEAEKVENKSPYRTAFNKVDLKLAKQLYQAGCRVPTLLPEHVSALAGMIEKKGDQALPMVKLLVEECGLKPSEMRVVDRPNDKTAVTKMAAASGSLPLLRYFIEQGCEVNTSVFVEAAIKGHLHLLVWMRAEYPALSLIDYNLIMLVEDMGQLEVAAWLEEELDFQDWEGEGGSDEEDSDEDDSDEEESDSSDDSGADEGGAPAAKRRKIEEEEEAGKKD
jgi:hypothetical protein